MCFIKVKHSFGHISGMVGLIDVKQKGSASVGHWVQYVTLTFDLTHGLDLRCFKVKFWNSCISGIVGLIDVKWKRGELIWYLGRLYDLALWPHPWLWPSSWNFKVTVLNTCSFSSGLGRSIDMERKVVSHPFMTMVWPWWGGRMYCIVTGVTSDFSVPSTYRVSIILMANQIMLVYIVNDIAFRWCAHRRLWYKTLWQLIAVTMFYIIIFNVRFCWFIPHAKSTIMHATYKAG